MDPKAQKSIELNKHSFPKDDWYYKYYYDMKKITHNCARCGNCRWTDPYELKEARFAKGCPTNAYHLFDAYSCQGKMDVILGVLEGRITYDNNEKLLDIIYACDTCGNCDSMCKRSRDTETIRVMLDMRAKLVEDGQMLPQHMPIIDSMKKEDNTMMGKKADRGNWAKELTVKDLTKETAEVCFHAGCQISFNPDLWKVAQTAIKILQKLGVDVGIFGKGEACCGGKAYDLGYLGQYITMAENNLDAWRTAKVKTIITACSDCYYAFKKLYADQGSKVQVYHLVEYIEKMIQEKKVKFTKSVPLKVCYHDPCHLGRRMDNYVPGKAISGVYDPPRNILKSIPGIEFVEMYRIKEFAWCCGSGGGVREAYPDFSEFTADERIIEAKAVGAEAIVAACPWCEAQFNESVERQNDRLKVYDIIELVDQAL